MTAYVDGLVAVLSTQKGDRYRFGAEASWRDADPDAFDCSEYLEWGGRRIGLTPPLPDGAAAQLAHCRRHNTLVSLQVGVALRGALLFRIGRGGNHVALSLGHGRTLEARGRAYGVNEFPSLGRRWTHAARIPGLAYPLPPKRPQTAAGGWYHRLLSLGSTGPDVKHVQRVVGVKADGDYGPKTRAAVIHWQHAHGLDDDGVVGPRTAAKMGR